MGGRTSAPQPSSRTAPRAGSASSNSRGTSESTARSAKNVDDLARKNPKASSGLQRAGNRLLEAQNVALRTSIALATGSRLSPGIYSGRGVGTNAFGNGYGGHGYGYGGYGFGGYGNNHTFNWWYGYGFGGSFSNYCGWYGSSWWNVGSYISCWYPWWRNWWVPNYYAPYSATRAVYETVYEPAVQTVYVDSAPVGEAIALAPPAAANRPQIALGLPGPARLSLAAERYLSLGDNAFREGRFNEAVQAYSRAIEYAPNQAALYLLLADALFAAGDYHYAAYTLRRAHELEPELLTSVIDKHAFYDDPKVYDRQIAVLEQYLIDRPDDRDARLVLAVNFLFAGRPAACVDLLRQLDSQELVGEAIAQDLLETGMVLQFGATAPTEAR